MAYVDNDYVIHLGERRAALPFAEPSDSTRFLFQEYWVDFLGGLLPGTLFLAACFVLLTPIAVIYFSIASHDFNLAYFNVLKDAIGTTKDTPSVIWFALGTAFVVLSYVLGHLFYRQDPNVPNQRSFSRLRKKEMSAKHADLDEYLKREYACTSKEDCQFPFPYFDMYLLNRGMDHLVPLVLWKGAREHRSKNWINILKIRLKLHFPNRCSTIIRNEAHVRLASSTWYVGKTLRRCSAYAFIGLVLSTAFFYAALRFPHESPFWTIDKVYLPNIISNSVVSFVSIIVIFLAGQFVSRRIERFLHYQRQREVVHVLETAWTAFHQRPSLLNPPFKDYL